MEMCDTIVNVGINQVKCGSTVFQTGSSFHVMRVTFGDSAGDKVFCESCQQEFKSIESPVSDI